MLGGKPLVLVYRIVSFSLSVKIFLNSEPVKLGKLGLGMVFELFTFTLPHKDVRGTAASKDNCHNCLLRAGLSFDFEVII